MHSVPTAIQDRPIYGSEQHVVCVGGVRLERANRRHRLTLITCCGNEQLHARVLLRVRVRQKQKHNNHRKADTSFLFLPSPFSFSLSLSFLSDKPRASACSITNLPLPLQHQHHQSGRGRLPHSGLLLLIRSAHRQGCLKLQKKRPF